MIQRKLDDNKIEDKMIKNYTKNWKIISDKEKYVDIKDIGQITNINNNVSNEQLKKEIK